MGIERGDTIRINGVKYVVTSIKNGVYGVPTRLIDPAGTSGSAQYLGTVEAVTLATLGKVKYLVIGADGRQVEIKATTIERAAEIYVRRAKRTRTAVRLTGVNGMSGRFQGYDTAPHGGQEAAGSWFLIRPR